MICRDGWWFPGKSKVFVRIKGEKKWMGKWAKPGGGNGVRGMVNDG